MSKERFTKGPWFITEHGTIKSDYSKTATQAISVSGVSTPMYACDEAKANAALIAVSPDMYAELKEVVKGLNLLIYNSAVNAIYLPALYEQVERIEALLAKARGE